MSAPDFSTRPAEMDDVARNGQVGEDEEVEELSIVVEDGMVLLYSESEDSDWELPLSPSEARELGEALIAAADDAEAPTE